MNALMTPHTDFCGATCLICGRTTRAHAGALASAFLHAGRRLKNWDLMSGFVGCGSITLATAKPGFSARTISVVQLTAERV